MLYTPEDFPKEFARRQILYHVYIIHSNFTVRNSADSDHFVIYVNCITALAMKI